MSSSAGPYVEDADLLALAASLERAAEQVRTRAALLRAAVGQTSWRGQAARAFDEQAAALLLRAERAADSLERAAAALRTHARATAEHRARLHRALLP